MDFIAMVLLMFSFLPTWFAFLVLLYITIVGIVTVLNIWQFIKDKVPFL